MSAPVAEDPCHPSPLRVPTRRGPVPVVEVLATGGIGGAQQHVVTLVERLDRERFVPHVVSLSDGPAARRIEALGVPMTVVHERDDAAAIVDVAAILAGTSPAIVHNHMYRAEVVGTGAVLRALAMGVPRPFIVSTVHSSRVRRASERALLARLTPEMDRLVAVSRSIARKIDREGRRGTAVELIPNGVDLEPPASSTREDVRAEFGLAADVPLVGVIARIEPEKGHPTLLDAWPLVLRVVPDARLLVVGEGSRQLSLEATAARLGLVGGPAPSVIFTGRRDDVAVIAGAIDVAVLPSYREAQGLSLLEAMALARPIVATRVGGIPEFVEDGVTGLLVPPRDPAALAGALVRVLGDRRLAQRLGARARELVAERYCLDLMVQRIEDLYEEGVAAQAALAAVQRRSA